MTSVSSISRYELVLPPAPNTVARPATEGACQVRLQLSMLLLPRTTRESLPAAKLTSLVERLQEKIPNVLGPCASPAARSPSTVRSERLVPAGWAERSPGAAVAVAHERRGQADVLLRHWRTSRGGSDAGECSANWQRVEGAPRELRERCSFIGSQSGNVAITV